MSAREERTVVLGSDDNGEICFEFDRSASDDQAVDVRAAGGSLVATCSLGDVVTLCGLLADFVSYHRPPEPER